MAMQWLAFADRLREFMFSFCSSQTILSYYRNKIEILKQQQKELDDEISYLTNRKRDNN